MASCASKALVVDAESKAPEIPKINMSEELAKIDTLLKADSPNVASAHGLFLLALDLMEADRIMLAELAYKKALANDPESYFLLSELIKILLRQNKTGEALSLLQLAVQSPKATAENFLYAARLYKENGSLDSSETYYQKALEKMGDNYAVLFEYAQLLEFLLRASEAKNDESESARIANALKDIFDVLLAELDYPSLLLQEQLRLYQKTNTSDSATADLLGAAFKAKGIEYSIYGILQAEILASLKKYSEANEVLLTIFFMDSSRENSSAIALRIAHNFELMDSVPAAVIWLEQLLAREPENHIAMNNLGYMLIDRDLDIERGIVLVDKALTYSPKEQSYLDSKAWGLYKIGKHKEALEILEKLAADGMDANELWEHLVAVCEALNLEEKAKEYRARIK
jgi:predicted Zn-dependent protease